MIADNCMNLFYTHGTLYIHLELVPKISIALLNLSVDFVQRVDWHYSGA